VALIGYDDIDYCELVTPSLTTVSMSKFEIGKCAAEMLFRQIRAPGKHGEWEENILKPRLMARDST
jgi:DNA-binding LacI/PurR family transcriptional regulator